MSYTKERLQEYLQQVQDDQMSAADQADLREKVRFAVVNREPGQRLPLDAEDAARQLLYALAGKSLQRQAEEAPQRPQTGLETVSSEVLAQDREKLLETHGKDVDVRNWPSADAQLYARIGIEQRWRARE